MTDQEFGNELEDIVDCVITQALKVFVSILIYQSLVVYLIPLDIRECRVFSGPCITMTLFVGAIYPIVGAILKLSVVLGGTVGWLYLTAHAVRGAQSLLNR